MGALVENGAASRFLPPLPSFNGAIRDVSVDGSALSPSAPSALVSVGARPCEGAAAAAAPCPALAFTPLSGGSPTGSFFFAEGAWRARAGPASSVTFAVGASLAAASTHAVSLAFPSSDTAGTARVRVLSASGELLRTVYVDQRGGAGEAVFRVAGLTPLAAVVVEALPGAGAASVSEVRVAAVAPGC